MADLNSCRTCKYRDSGDDAYHCYMFKVEPEPLCMLHQDRKPKRIGTIGHVGIGRATLTAAVAAILARQESAPVIPAEGAAPAGVPEVGPMHDAKAERECFEAAYAAIPPITPTKETAWRIWIMARAYGLIATPGVRGNDGR